ncbi:FAD-linked oxidase [Marmoricola endophyticus]|uniref:FAD-linked oxidase n=1 Tax=Marmoricola endophyticus TaxID=2040280 RepID=A0A917F613_9ACTN|nr:FAD-linked oxidase C-terminal domain-containing protein [Marmoricola endophyticus]GGF51508.1 FAD-linked oxidase [Marmoricola endophyticus]
MTTPDLPSLAEVLPAGVLTTEPATLEGYRFDWSHDETAGTPLAVVRAESAEQVQAAVRWAAAHRVPVVPRGAGSGLSGGASAVDGGIVVSLERMRAIEIDAASGVAVVEPGALNAAVKQAAAAEGLWYPPDPASYEMCSIGGNIATNAGGLCCVKYGVTADYVLGLDVVLADGTLVTLGGKRVKDVAGLPLLKLYVGSEGTLGIVTRAVLRLVPSQGPLATMVATFASMTEAARAVVEIRRRMRPSMLELMDTATINAVEDLKPRGLDREAGAFLIAQSDAPGDARGLEIEAMGEVCEASGAAEVLATTDPEESEMFVDARRAAFTALETKGSALLEDVGVPVPLLPELVGGVARIAAERETTIAVVAHAGDGNSHPFIVFDANDPDAVARSRRAFEDVMALAISLGGTITGEHGVGRAKRDALPAQLGEDVMALNLTVKRALDPAGILNPGALL